MGEWSEDRKVGLMAYGHRRRGDCSDIETLVTPSKSAREEILSRINSITPTGKTPLTDAIEQAAIALSYTDQPATVVLISDGLESCGRDPCALAAALEKAGVGFTAHVVGFGLSGDADAASLSCIAENTGGRYISASNATELGQALSEVAVAVAEAPKPEPEPVPEAPKVTLTVPKTAIAGSEITVGWSPTIAERDYVTIGPVGSKEGTYETYVTVGTETEGLLTMPAFAGQYEVRYVLNETRKPQGVETIEIIDPDITLTGPEQITAGALFDISWQNGVNRRDYITIVPVGADEGTYDSYFTVENFSEGILTAAPEPGLYELRYVLNQGARTVARRAIEVLETEVTLQGPDTALAGSAFDVSWAGAVGENDYITIVPMGADEGTYGNYFVVQDNSKDELSAPADPGLYELRYILREGDKTTARAAIEITEPEVTISGPETALAGSEIKVTWTGEVDEGDYITIVPMGTDEGTYGNYITTRGTGENSLQAPSEPGLYELRYALRESARTMARASIEITEPEVTVSGPDTALAGSRVEVSWTGAVANNDYVTIVPMGSDEGTFGNYKTLRNDTKTDLKAPADPGIYEIRYILREGSKTLARQMIEITEPKVSLEAPNEIRAGDKLRVGWTGTVADNDYIALVPMGSEDSEFGTYFVVRDRAESDMKAPDETGLYELRYILREGGRVLARTRVEVVTVDAALEAGASLSAPDTAAPGAVIKVNWDVSSDSADQRITLARGNQPIFTWLQAVKITGDGPVEITLPKEPGVYELRFLDLSNQAVLSRKVIKVE
ncbi:Glutamine synthetase type I [hydrothermal vent metagenome]|uniref:Glutamine synthetase type I n=1 Tax=hydrothermal vent metagenome TaxID=652676 RepID=A0A3B0S1N4_9ZZZZ